MPIHAHDRAERLEPERVREPTQYFVTPVMKRDGLHDHTPELRHARAQPLRHVAAMQRKIGTSRSASHPGLEAVDCGLLAWQHRSEEHTSELQSRENLVCRLLL